MLPGTHGWVQQKTIFLSVCRPYICTFICSVRGVVTYISPSYGGSCSDRQIIEILPLLRGMFSAGDKIMAEDNEGEEPVRTRNCRTRPAHCFKARPRREGDWFRKDIQNSGRRFGPLKDACWWPHCLCMLCPLQLW
jgi:hypothetical protein